LSVWTVVVAAGTGSRFGGPKQFAKIRGRSIADWSVAAARTATDGVVLVLPPGDPHLAAGDLLGADAVVAGGETRSDSVRAGLARVPEDADVIVVHDGARPLATANLFKQVVEEVKAGADAVVPALPVTDTLKEVTDGLVTGQVDRRLVQAVQTPQAFKASVLRAAHSSGEHGTDDATLVENCGGRVTVVPGEQRNIKVTTPADLELVQALAET
jgi:2-C-methyl-D-erythritol 4-phosphate cytidylyltransferase